MRFLTPIALFCAACSGGALVDEAGDGSPAASPARAAYATQVTAPPPDYRALLAAPPLAKPDRLERAPTARLPVDAGAVGDAWIARLEARQALLGSGRAGKAPDSPVNLIDTAMTEAEFDRWTRDQGWQIPAHIRWRFVPPKVLPPVSAAAGAAMRVWPASRVATGAQNAAALYGRVELRDGCFYAAEGDGPADRLAFFHAEVGLDRDADGFLILRDRVSGQVLARVGEELMWGGPPSAVIDPATRAALIKACGPGDILVVGTPQSRERMMTRYPHLRPPASPPKS